jgi:hypothetical protein
MKSSVRVIFGLKLYFHVGISLMHDEGTGGNTNGGYGIFPLFPLLNCAFTSCPVALDNRKTLRAAGVDSKSTLLLTLARHKY